MPLSRLLKWWHRTGLGVEVTSNYELLAVLREGFPAEKIMVNGVAKHFWPRDSWIPRLRVNFDSLTEISQLGGLARELNWSVGIRFHAGTQYDPENPGQPDQFGISAEWIAEVCCLLEQQNLVLDTVHMHLRSNIPSKSHLMVAVNELVRVLGETGVAPRSVDLGGGLPATFVKQRDRLWESRLSEADVVEAIKVLQAGLPSVRETILENGRYLLSDSGVLALTVLDIKLIGQNRFVICDGGRTNHALPSDWEEHEICVLPSRGGPCVETSICGPTCMAYDCLTRTKLPRDIRIGDKIIWFDAGAYHLSWETRFSQPLASILWYDEEKAISVVRDAESFEEWWERR